MIVAVPAVLNLTEKLVFTPEERTAVAGICPFTSLDVSVTLSLMVVYRLLLPSTAYTLTVTTALGVVGSGDPVFPIPDVNVSPGKSTKSLFCASAVRILTAKKNESKKTSFTFFVKILIGSHLKLRPNRIDV
ncbi:hypothetical protein D3C85_1363100 [compost metagenome]